MSCSGVASFDDLGASTIASHVGCISEVFVLVEVIVLVSVSVL